MTQVVVEHEVIPEVSHHGSVHESHFEDMYVHSDKNKCEDIAVALLGIRR